jgi:hypothetical protein
MNIREGYRKSDEENFLRYINVLRYEIEEEISIMKMWIVEDAYQEALKEEDKLARKQSQ